MLFRSTARCRLFLAPRHDSLDGQLEDEVAELLGVTASLGGTSDGGKTATTAAARARVSCARTGERERYRGEGREDENEREGVGVLHPRAKDGGGEHLLVGDRRHRR